jgi:hypothetical protein
MQSLYLGGVPIVGEKNPYGREPSWNDERGYYETPPDEIKPMQVHNVSIKIMANYDKNYIRKWIQWADKIIIPSRPLADIANSQISKDIGINEDLQMNIESLQRKIDRNNDIINSEGKTSDVLKIKFDELLAPSTTDQTITNLFTFISVTLTQDQFNVVKNNIIGR